MKVRSGFVSNSSSSSFILGIPKDMTPEEFAEKIDKDRFSECYGRWYKTPEEFFQKEFEKESEFKLDSVLNHILGLESRGFYSRVFPCDVALFFDAFEIPVEDRKNKSLAEIVSGLIKDYNLYELSVERGYDYRGVFGDLILFEDNC